MATPILRSYLTVNGVMLGARWAHIIDLTALTEDPALEGADRYIPGAGLRVYPREPLALEVVLPLRVNGMYLQDDTLAADPRNQWKDHVAYLKANLGHGLQTGDGTVTTVWRHDDGGDVSAATTVLGLGAGRRITPAIVETTLALRFPEGGFA